MTDGPHVAPHAQDAPLPVARRVLRPLGYLLVGLVWTALALVVLALGPGILLWAALDGGLELAPLLAGPASDPGEAVALLLAVPLLVVLWGAGVLGVLPAATWPLAALSFVYVARSFDPRRAHEPLSATRRVGPGAATGVPTAFSVALSLQPVHGTRTTDLLMRWYVTGWQPEVRQVVAMLPAGAAWLLAFAGIAQDVPVAARVALLVAAAALAAWSAVLARRAWRRRFHDAPVLGDVPVSALDPAQRRARLAAARARRGTRTRPGR
ncbi:hypothetical protein ATJ88_3329 [Isoptericola jiangsuensis]|uniref:Uncharacterized protein n=1 Tax=Isoptericola jiangsuensis TaxID=548579 RepID=A0A2A9F2F6_9MICO|nr:hypothetical protein [Isoptericola jiangsuensis]PFG44599.1 hypothetical protein ATJ88_3329 [Isoptericola jiangsuensis]